jgi:ADP-heptose:LPS heptosyltransferase
VQVQRIPAFLEQIQGQDFDLAIQLQGSGYITNPLVTLFGARRTAGYYLPEQYCPDEESFLPYPENLPEPNRLLALMEHLGFPTQGEELEFPLNEADRTEFGQLAEIFGLEAGRYVCIHPGARAPERRWDAASFATVADWFAAQGIDVVLTGTESEGDIASKVNRSMKYPAHDLTGRTSLGGLAYLIREASLLISNDTGPSHIAAALEVPSVVLFSASDPNRWAPQNRNLHRVIENAKDFSPELVIHEISTLLHEVNVYVG